jgi:AraC-like DNA-binding protein
MHYSFWKIKFLLLLIPISLYSQTDTKNISQLSYKELRTLFYSNKGDSINQIKYAFAYLKKAETNKDLLNKAKAYYMYSQLNKGDKAIAYLDSVTKYSKDSNDKFFPATSYCEKAFILQDQYKFKEAMQNYLQAEKIALKTNLDYYYLVKRSIGLLKSEKLGEVEEGIAIYRECYKYYKKKHIKDKKYYFFFLPVLFSMADSHKALLHTDSTSYYNKLGYKESKVGENDYFSHLFILNEGANEVIKKNYNAALDSIKKALPKMIQYEDKMNILASYYYQGLSFKGQGKKDMATKCFIKVDSMYNKTNQITPEFISGYDYLVSYYKEKGDKINQLEYLTKQAALDKILQKNYKQMYKLLQKEYDIPHLVLGKELQIKSLKKNASLYYWGIGGLFAIVLGLGLFSFYQRKLYKNRFEKVIANTKTISPSTTIPIEDKVQDNIDKQYKDIIIAEDLRTAILEKLKNFETNKGYLQSNITLQILSDQFKTNKKYLAKIIKEYRDKSFIPYINDLRIDNAVIQLQENKKFLEYDMEGLAAEFGFNNAQSFGNAFYKKTELKPAFFVKELKKNNMLKI